MMLLSAGCRQDMQNQPKFIPLRGSDFFSDGRSVRTQVPGTVARSQGDPNSYFLTGKIDGKEGSAFPIPVTFQMLQRGQERFNIFCSPCHSRVGDGHGRIVQRGFYQAADFHSERLRQAPAGHFFNVITNGHGAMPNYRTEIAPVDRWAIVAYIRALQLSQDAKRVDAGDQAISSLSEIAYREGLPESFGGSNSGSFIASSIGNAEKGKDVFMQNCQMCHQANRGGLPPVIPSLVDIVSRVGEPHIRQTVANGVPTAQIPMPSFAGKLSPTDVDNLIAFLKTKP